MTSFVTRASRPCGCLGNSIFHFSLPVFYLSFPFHPLRIISKPMTETLTLQFDGGSRGNPGPAGIGVVLRAADGTPLVTLGRFIGRATNNVAEYRALITGLEKARELGAKKIRIRGDSELVIKQMRGEYRVKSLELKSLFDEAKR